MTAIANIIGTGTDADPYRSAVADLGIDHECEIASDRFGRPLHATTVTRIPRPTPAQLLALQADPRITQITP